MSSSWTRLLSSASKWERRIRTLKVCMCVGWVCGVGVCGVGGCVWGGCVWCGWVCVVWVGVCACGSHLSYPVKQILSNYKKGGGIEFSSFFPPFFFPFPPLFFPFWGGGGGGGIEFSSFFPPFFSFFPPFFSFFGGGGVCVYGYCI